MVVVVAALVIIPLVELALIIQVGSWIGLWPTVALLAAGSILGAYLLKRQGGDALTRFRASLSQGQVPIKEAADGGLITTGGILLLVPGFLTDLMGLLLLAKPSRDLVRSRFFKVDRFHDRVEQMRRRQIEPEWDVEGTVVEEKLEITEKASQ